MVKRLGSTLDWAVTYELDPKIKKVFEKYRTGVAIDQTHPLDKEGKPVGNNDNKILKGVYDTERC